MSAIGLPRRRQSRAPVWTGPPLRSSGSPGHLRCPQRPHCPRRPRRLPVDTLLRNGQRIRGAGPVAGDLLSCYLAPPGVLCYQDCRLMPFGRVAAAVAPHLPLLPPPVRRFTPAVPPLRSRCRAKSRRRSVELLPGRYSARPCKLALAEPPGRPGRGPSTSCPARAVAA